MIRRNAARAGRQNGAVGENLTAKEITGQLFETAFDLAGRSFTRKHRLPAPLDFNFDFPRAHGSFGRPEGDPRTQRAGTNQSLAVQSSTVKKSAAADTSGELS